MLLKRIGITLHVEKCGEKDAHDITFYRSRSSYVNIGRKSASGDKAMRRENDDHNAVFACQVVSARHAKLVLSVSGQVYIVDLNSRHGTHLSRPGEAPRALKPEIETPLADGDILTFGKAVGSAACMVLPVTARVELLREKPDPVASPSVPSLTPINSLVNLISRPSKCASGRYGLFVPTPHADSPSSHSSDSLYVLSDGASSVSDDHDSDIEEVSVSSLDLGKHPLHVKIPTFRSLIHMCTNNEGSRSPSAKEALHTLVDYLAPPSPSVEDTSLRGPPHVINLVDLPSRSHSPMELSTPSPSPSEEHHVELPVIGAWPTSRPASPDTPIEPEVATNDTTKATENETSEEVVDVPTAPATETVQERGPTMLPDIHPHFIDLSTPPYFGPPFGRMHSSPFTIPPPALPVPNPIPERVGSELRTSIKIVEDRVSAMQETITDLKTRQCFTEEDVMDLQTHIDMLGPESDRFLCRLNLAERNIASLSTLQNQINSLKSRLDNPEPKPVEIPANDVKACADALGSLVAEMKCLRDSAEKRIDEKMEAIDAARASALNVIAVEALNSLKRKRVEEDEPVKDTPDHVMKDTAEPQADLPPSQPVPDNVRESKRARTTAVTVAQTAAAMAVGAVVTWSALAFA
ncbi:hypothetical protein ID866_7134 [Astraeus odoratus]|nr:hypothetical protein ID866_7134 [Astraeus odoratus]